MSKYWQIGSRDDALCHSICAPTQAEAIKQLETITGPQNPSRRIIKEVAPFCQKCHAPMVQMAHDTWWPECDCAEFT